MIRTGVFAPTATTMFRMRRSFACLVLLAALLPAMAAVAHAPELNAKDLAGQPQKLSALRGQIVVLNFWATWCAPCQAELPRFSRLSQEYASRYVRFVAVSVDEPRDIPKVQPFVTKKQLTLDVWTGASIDDAGRFGLGDSLPATIVLDAQGAPVTRFQGEASDEEIRARIDWLLNGRKGAAPAPLVKHE